MKILVPLADGFEEIEMIVPVDIWRRADLEVITAALSSDEKFVRAARETGHVADEFLKDCIDEPFDLIFIPGGKRGAEHLFTYQPLLDRLKKQADAGLWLAAICAGPLVLAHAGLLTGKRFTAHPSAEESLARFHLTPVNERLVVDGKLITAKAAGCAFDLAFKVVELFCEKERAEVINSSIFYRPAEMCSSP